METSLAAELIEEQPNASSAAKDSPGEVVLATEASSPAMLLPVNAARRSLRSRVAGAVRDFFAPGWIGRTLRGGVLLVLGVPTLVLGLAVLATFPVLQILTLGYMLEVSGRVARTGRMRDGLVGLKPAATFGLLLAILGIAWLPLKLVSLVWASGEVIAPSGTATGMFQNGLLLGLVVFFCGLIAASALFEWFRPGTYARGRDRLYEILVRRLPYYGWLGLRGFVGSALWLVVPVSMLAAASTMPESGRPIVMLAAALLRFTGSLMLAVVVVHLPLLQTHFAQQKRFAALFDVGVVRRYFKQAPLACAVAMTASLLLAIPLYTLKIEIVPRDAAWLPSILFVATTFPARLLLGWAWSRSQRRGETARWYWRWPSKLWLIPVSLAYVLAVFLGQYTGWYGVWGMYEQHAFLLPVPFLGL